MLCGAPGIDPLSGEPVAHRMEFRKVVPAHEVRLRAEDARRERVGVSGRSHDANARTGTVRRPMATSISALAFIAST